VERFHSTQNGSGVPKQFGFHLSAKLPEQVSAAGVYMGASRQFESPRGVQKI